MTTPTYRFDQSAAAAAEEVRKYFDKPFYDPINTDPVQAIIQSAIEKAHREPCYYEKFMEHNKSQRVGPPATDDKLMGNEDERAFLAAIAKEEMKAMNDRWERLHKVLGTNPEDDWDEAPFSYIERLQFPEPTGYRPSKAAPATDDAPSEPDDYVRVRGYKRPALHASEGKPDFGPAHKTGVRYKSVEELKSAHASEQGAEWIPLADGRGKCGVKDKEGWIARGLTEHQAMTISAAHKAALAAATQLERNRWQQVSHDFTKALEQLAAEHPVPDHNEMSVVEGPVP